MKPFKAKTKNGDKWYFMNGNSLVEVDVVDVPNIVARIEKAKNDAAAAAHSPQGFPRLKDPDSLELMALAGMGMSMDVRFPNEHVDIWSCII